MGAAQKRRGNIKGHEKGRFRKCDGKPDDWMVWMEENKPNELEALEKQRSARLGGKGRFRKDEGKPHDWTAWEKEHQKHDVVQFRGERATVQKLYLRYRQPIPRSYNNTTLCQWSRQHPSHYPPPQV
jgi:phage I-like protein